MEFPDEHKNAVINLVLNHWDMSGVLELLDNFYPAEEEEAGSSEETENSSAGTHTLDMFVQATCPSGQGGVQYGSATDLLAFIKRISGTAHGTQANSNIHLNQDTGVLLSKHDMILQNGHYRIDSEVSLFPWKRIYRNADSAHIPKGAFGRVHLALDCVTRKRMACKLIPLEHFRYSDVEIQARFGHENVAELFGAILREGTLYVFMEAGEGGSVLEKLDSCGPMREAEVIWVSRQVLQALEYLHSKGVIHHDIKPSNIVLTSAKAVLVDFGLSVQMSEDSQVYNPKDLRGTEMYMSPELVLCGGHNTKTDIYSLGSTMIHMLTGSAPWVRRFPRTAYPSYLYIIHKLAPPLEEIPESCSTPLRSVLHSALHRNPARRGSASALLQHHALNPTTNQTRYTSLDSALGEGTRPFLSQFSNTSDTTQGE
ncbi:mitogen-activated protein kinase kinase kinase 8 isoform X2 [Clupea harengus]|uniref:Mitogen-activated protein kinase kinase kinase 8 isoform X2 n=1 Tax=Clupea harengus TaxID=7950 RepID=A0A6P8GQW9_CLUHA|nr:mitogen-activated protein kinase kinase kinase 8 isoform X2 [Clupea harengus]